MEKVVSIKNASGLHARPAGMFVKKAAEFKSTVEVVAKDKNCKCKINNGNNEFRFSSRRRIKVSCKWRR